METTIGAKGITLVADSGSTKTDWILVDNGTVVCRCATQGINPVHQTYQDINAVIFNELMPQLKGHIVDTVYFYGAGCSGKAAEHVQHTLATVFNVNECKAMAYSDLLGAARAVCGKNAGIVCILGTGSNSCVYNGCDIIANIPPLGYILGDEGSGAVLGRLFLNAIFKDNGLRDLRDEFLDWSGLTYEDIINSVYRQPLANRFLASISAFIGEHIDNVILRNIVKDNFRAFFRNNIIRYNRCDLRVNAVGSIAYHYRELFRETAYEEGFEIGEIIKSPIDGLAVYHY